MSSFSIDGIASGFDTTSIIESLVGFQNAQIETFNQRKSAVTEEKTAFKGIEAQLITLRSNLTRLGRSRSAIFRVNQASSSNENILKVAAGNEATPGTYSLTVESLATANQIGSQGFSSLEDTVATGEITIALGDQPATTIAIDGTNNTIQDVVQTINQRVDDVNASIIFDQGASSYRLLLTSNKTGASNQISFSSSPSDGGTELDFSGPAIEEAADAVIRLGSGPGAITASYSENVVNDLIEDVTIDLQSADAGTVVNITVAKDTAAAVDAVQQFVDSFNATIDFIDEQTRFDPESGIASPLLGDRDVTNIKNRITSFVIESVAGVEGSNRLSDVGIDINLQGKLTFDTATFTDALNGNVDGVDPDNISKLFGLDATSTNSGIRYVAGSDNTVAGGNEIEVNIIQAAERAQVTGTNAVASSIVIDGSNNEFEIKLNGNTSETLTINSGTYTREEFATEIENLINGSDELGVNDLEVTIDGDNKFVFTSELYGKSSEISSIAGTAAAEFGFDGSETATGLDVVGEFIVDGVSESATGVGQLLRGDVDNENTADLQFVVSLTASEIVTGSESTVVVTRGASGRMGQYVGELLNVSTGRLKTVSEEFDARIESIDRSIEGVEQLVASRRESLLAEFAALETIISELNTTSDFLSSQFTALSANRRN